MGTACRWDHTHWCIITLQLRCHARAGRLCGNPHFMNSFPNYRSGGAGNVLFLEYLSTIQNDWKLLKGHVVEHSNLAEQRYGYGLPAMQPTG